MADHINAENQAPRTPQITSLSTAFPMHFETNNARPGEDARKDQPQTTRAPHRHDAGE